MTSSPSPRNLETQGDNESMRRNLHNRHIQMIALGGAIGTGLFYGSADSIAVAGPAILLTYVVGGAVIFLIMRALGEMSVHHPVSGAFSHYAHENWSERAGFVSGWNYWLNYVLVAMAELSVVGSYIRYWFPGVPDWMTAAFCLVLITAVNLMGVRAFGEFEFWFALIKVLAVIGMVVLGLIIIIFGMRSSAETVPPSFTNLWTQGGFFPKGVHGAFLGLVVVMFSFGGIELIGIAAGEASDPKRSIPKAINQVIWRILLFYVLSLAVIMSVIPWNQINGQMSPFVQIFDTAGFQFAAHILNFVVLTAALSVYNSGLYSNGRMLYSLAQQGNAPKVFERLSAHGSPFMGILASSAVTVIAVVVVLLWPDFAFQYLLAIALFSAIINWTMIIITQMLFRRRLGKKAVKELSFKLPGGKVSSFIVLAFLALVVVQMAFIPQYRMALIVGPLWLIVLLLGYEVKKRRRVS